MGVPSKDLVLLETYLRNSAENHIEISVSRVSDRDLLSHWLILRDLFTLLNSVRARTLGRERLRSLVLSHIGEGHDQLREFAELLLGLIDR